MTSTVHPIRALCDALARSAAPPRATVESEPDPRHPGRRAYRLTGPTRESVQIAITRLVNVADDGGGSAMFVGPLRVGREWSALGEVILPVEAAHG